MNSDFEASRLHLNMYVEEFKDEGVPFEILRFLIGTINYGGRVTDDKDEKLIAAILAKYYDDLIFDDLFKFSESGLYYAPKVDSMETIGAYIEQLPLDDEPEVFGLHNNANITLQNKMVREFMEPLLSIQPRSSSSGGKKPDEIVLDIKFDIDEKFSEVKLFDPNNYNPFSVLVNPEGDNKEENKEATTTTTKKKKKDEDKKKKSPQGNFLLQEVDKFNNLIKVMKSSLHSLE